MIGHVLTAVAGIASVGAASYGVLRPRGVATSPEPGYSGSEERETTMTTTAKPAKKAARKKAAAKATAAPTKSKHPQIVYMAQLAVEEDPTREPWAVIRAAFESALGHEVEPQYPNPAVQWTHAKNPVHELDVTKYPAGALVVFSSDFAGIKDDVDNESVWVVGLAGAVSCQKAADVADRLGGPAIGYLTELDDTDVSAFIG